MRLASSNKNAFLKIVFHILRKEDLLPKELLWEHRLLEKRRYDKTFVTSPFSN